MNSSLRSAPPPMSRKQLLLRFDPRKQNNWAEQSMAFTKSKYKVTERKEG